MSLPTKSALLHEEIFAKLSLLDLDFPLGPCWALFPMSLPTKSALLHEEIFRVVSSAKLCFACTSHLAHSSTFLLVTPYQKDIFPTTTLSTPSLPQYTFPSHFAC